MKSKSKSKTTNTYGWQTPPQTQAMSQYGQAINTSFDTPDPSIGYQFGAARQRVDDRFDNPFGQDYSPEVRDAMTYGGHQQLDQAQGQATREDSFRRKEGKLGHQAAYAGMTAPQLVQTGGTFQGSQSQPWGPALIGAAGTAAGGFLS